MAKILLAEDEPLLVRMIAEVLEEEGLAFDTAKDGAQAHEMLISGAYDLVLTDIQMPKMSGVDLLRSIKKNKSVHQPQWWFALTAHTEEDTDKEGISLFDESFFKPFSPTFIAKLIKQKLEAVEDF